MSSRTATLVSGNFTWNDTTTLQVDNGATAQIDLFTVNTTFAGFNPLVWSGGQPTGSSVTVVSPNQLRLTVPNSLKEGDKSYLFAVNSAAPTQSSNLTILLKGNPG